MITKMLRPLNTAKYIADLYKINIDRIPEGSFLVPQKDNFVLIALETLRCFGVSSTLRIMAAKILKGMIGFAEQCYDIKGSYHDFPVQKLVRYIGEKSIFDFVEVAGGRVSGTDVFLEVYDREYANKIGVTGLNMTTEPEKRFILTLLAPRSRRKTTTYISSLGTRNSDDNYYELSQMYNTYCYDSIDDLKFGPHSLVVLLDKLRIEGNTTIDHLQENYY